MSQPSTLVAAVAVAFALLAVPGGAVVFVARARASVAAAMAGPLSVLLIAGGAVALALVGIPFSAGSVLALCLAPVLVAAVVAVVRRRDTLDRLRAASRHLPAVVALVVAASVMAAVALPGFAPWGMPNQTYDGVFHANAVESILASGDASSLDLYSLNHIGGDGLEFYPAAWHGIVAAIASLSGASVPVAEAAAWLAIGVVCWTPGIMALTVTLFGGRTSRRTLLVLSAVLSSSYLLFPYLLLAWGTIWPTGLAYALLPAGMTIAVRLLRPGGFRAADIVAAVLWLGAAGFAHPRSLIGFALLVAPLALVAAARIVAAGWRRRRTLTATLLGVLLAAVLLIAAAAFWYLYTNYGLADRPLSDRLNGGPATARVDLVTALGQVLTLSPLLPPTETAAAPQFLLAALGIAAVVVLLRRGPHRWVAVSLLLVVVFYTLAAGSNGDIAKALTAAWYKDKYRLISLLPVLLAPVTAYAGAVLLQAARARGIRPFRIAAGAVAAVLLAVVLTPGLGAAREASATSYAVAEPGGDVLLDTDDRAVLEDVDDVVPEGERVVGDPWNGAILTWVLGDREPLFPHLTGVWGADRDLVAARLDLAATDPAVCEALDRLDVHYLYHSTSALWGGDDVQAAPFAALDRAASAEGFEPVLQEGTAALYEITACG